MNRLKLFRKVFLSAVRVLDWWLGTVITMVMAALQRLEQATRRLPATG